MPLLRRGLASSCISSVAQDIARGLLEQVQDATIRRQVIDANQLQRLSLTLNRSSLYSDLSVHGQHGNLPLNGTPLPPGYHLVYFTPAVLPNDLGPDGADIAYNPPAPFTRRMWAGGELAWQRDNPLRVGDDAVETTKLLSSVPKATRMGEEMIVVRVEKTFENSKGPSLVDKRDWVFRLNLPAPPSVQDYPEPVKEASQLPVADRPNMKTRDFQQTPVSLFRFSALTFNAHMIHYSRSWCREIEGQRDIVVHGPLNLINMLDFWRDEKGQDGYAIPGSIRYRATTPFYAGEKYRGLLETGDGKTSIRMWGNDGKGAVKVGMAGDLID